MLRTAQISWQPRMVSDDGNTIEVKVARYTFTDAGPVSWLSIRVCGLRTMSEPYEHR